MRMAQVFLLVVVSAVLGCAQDTNFSVGPQYLITTGSSMFLRPIATPSLSLSAPIPTIGSLPNVGPAVANQPYSDIPALENQANLFPVYYGYPQIMNVELSSSGSSAEVPASLSESGVTAMSEPQLMRESGYGTRPAEAASFWKAHKRPAKRVYTNPDIDRLRQNS